MVRRGWRVVAFLVVTGAARWSAAQDPAVIDKLVQLNKKAMDDFDTADFDASKKSLLDAEKLGKRAGLESHPRDGADVHSPRRRVPLGVSRQAEGPALLRQGARHPARHPPRQEPDVGGSGTRSRPRRPSVRPAAVVTTWCAGPAERRPQGGGAAPSRRPPPSHRRRSPRPSREGRAASGAEGRHGTKAVRGAASPICRRRSRRSIVPTRTRRHQGRS